ncbi:MAG: O-antigen ligase family protein [Brevundimonas sp.]
MIATILVIASLLAGFRWPGVLIAGALLTYQAGALSGIANLSTLYVVAALMISIYVGRRSLRRLRVGAIDAAFLAFLSIYVMTVLYSPAAADGFSEVFQILLPAVSLYVLGRLCTSSVDLRVLVVQVVGGVLVLGALYGILLYFNRGLAVSGRLGIGDSNAVGISQAFPLMLVAGVVAVYNLSNRKKFLLASLALMSTAIIFYVSLISATRSVYIATVASLILLLTISAARMRVWTFVGVVTLVGVILAPFLGAAIGSSDAQGGINRLLMNFRSGDFRLDLSGRLRLQQQELGWELFQDHPVFGTGLGGYDEITQRGYPHNMLLEVGSQSGIVGLSLLAIYISTLYWVGLQISKARPYAWLLLAFLTAALVHMQLSFALFMAKPLFLITGVLAAYSTIYLTKIGKRSVPKGNEIRARSAFPAKP